MKRATVILLLFMLSLLLFHNHSSSEDRVNIANLFWEDGTDPLEQPASVEEIIHTDIQPLFDQLSVHFNGILGIINKKVFRISEDQPTHFYYIPQNTHLQVQIMLEGQEQERVISEAKVLIAMLHNPIFQQMPLDLEALLNNILILNHLYLFYQSNLENLTYLYYGFYYFFKRSRVYLYRLLGSDPSLSYYDDYQEYMNQEMLDPWEESARSEAEIYVILNYQCFHFLETLSNFMLSRHPDNVEVLKIKAQLYFDYHQYDVALSILDKLLELEIENAYLYLIKGICLFHLNQSDYQDYLKEAVALNPNYSETYNTYTKSWVDKNQEKELQDQLENASSENISQPYFALLNYYLDNNQYEEAQALLTSETQGINHGGTQYALHYLDYLKGKLFFNLMNDLLNIFSQPANIIDVLLTKSKLIEEYVKKVNETLENHPKLTELKKHLIYSNGASIILSWISTAISVFSWEDRSIVAIQEIVRVQIQETEDKLIELKNKLLQFGTEGGMEIAFVDSFLFTMNALENLLDQLEDYDFSEITETDISGLSNDIYETLLSILQKWARIPISSQIASNKIAIAVMGFIDALSSFMQEEEHKDFLQGNLTLLLGNQLINTAGQNQLQLIPLLEEIRDLFQRIAGTIGNYNGIQGEVQLSLNRLFLDIAYLIDIIKEVIHYRMDVEGLEDLSTLPVSLFEKLKVFFNQYMNEPYLQYLRGQYYLFQANIHQNISYIPYALHYFVASINNYTSFNHSETNGFVHLGSDFNDFQTHVLQNLGICLAYMEHPFARWLSYSALHNEMGSTLSPFLYINYIIISSGNNPIEAITTLENELFKEDIETSTQNDSLSVYLYAFKWLRYLYIKMENQEQAQEISQILDEQFSGISLPFGALVSTHFRYSQHNLVFYLDLYRYTFLSPEIWESKDEISE